MPDPVVPILTTIPVEIVIGCVSCHHEQTVIAVKGKPHILGACPNCFTERRTIGLHETPVERSARIEKDRIETLVRVEMHKQAKADAAVAEKKLVDDITARNRAEAEAKVKIEFDEQDRLTKIRVEKAAAAAKADAELAATAKAKADAAAVKLQAETDAAIAAAAVPVTDRDERDRLARVRTEEMAAAARTGRPR